MEFFRRKTTPEHPVEDAVFPDSLFSGERHSVTVGSWRLSNMNSPFLLDALYEKGAAIYGFEVVGTENSIELNNYHREAAQGKGTESLADLESKLALLAKKIGKSVTLHFPVYGQSDTAAWLEKNGYSYDVAEDAYSKTVSG